MGTEITALLSATFAHCLASASATTHANWKKFSLIVLYCKKLSSRRSSVTQATMHSAGVSNCNDLPPWIGVGADRAQCLLYV